MAKPAGDLEAGGGGQGKGKAGPKAPLQVRVETTAKHMGQVNVAVSWEPKGAKLDFRNQFHDVRDLLRKFLPELEKSLALLDFKVTSWNYEMLPPDESAAPLPGSRMDPARQPFRRYQSRYAVG